MKVKSYRELIAWQKAMDFVVATYRQTTRFPKEEQYTLCSQLRRAVVSILSNIAEGQRRSTTRDFLHFLAVANGSVAEAETQLVIAQRLGYLDDRTTCALLEQSAEIGRLINGLKKALKRRQPPTTN
jgi:four helix bundle protein